MAIINGIQNIFKYYLPKHKVLRKILDKVFVNKKFARYKTSRTFQINVFEIPHNKDIGKLFSNYKLLFLDQANSSSDPSQILILKFLLTKASRSLSSFLSIFTLANGNPSSTQSSSCSSSVSIFCATRFAHTPSQVLDKPNHMPC